MKRKGGGLGRGGEGKRRGFLDITKFHPSAYFVLLAKFRQKEKSKMKILKTISIAIISETKSVKITRSFIFGFHYVAKNIEV
jgi:hypothetical protein